MTPAEFITEALTFDLGKIIVVSGPDYQTIWDLITQAGDALELSGKSTLLYDSRQKTLYEHRDFVWFANRNEAITFEYISLMAENAFVVLVANQFDREDPNQNPRKRTIAIDVVLDLFNIRNVLTIPAIGSPVYPIRELFSYMSKVYYYDTRESQIIFVKDQVAVRPP